jgi:hypothetical protein
VPLGSRGPLHGPPWDAIGFQRREITVDGEVYGWQEYVLFNPERGFRYLSEYNGHWNDIAPLKSLPVARRAAGRKAMTVLGETFRHFQTADATTVYVIGEFPWEARVGEQARVEDYVRPPRHLSAEISAGETTWSMGEYRTGAQIWSAFGLPGTPPRATGVFANQPSPHIGRPARYWRMFLVLAALLLLGALVRYATASRDVVFEDSYTWNPAQAANAAFVTEAFALRGGPANVEIAVDTTLRAGWLYFNLTLIDEASGRAWDAAQQVDAVDGEGPPRGRVRIGSVPDGRYSLRVEPEGAPDAPAASYRLTVRRDVPSMLFFWIALALLAVPPVLVSFRAAGFEGRRWRESDYG